MVRLRSNRWYSADNQSDLRQQVRQQTSGTRRLMSLIFMLGLVILLMQKAGDPRYVRQAFQALGVPLDREVIASTDSSTDAGVKSPAYQAATSSAGHDDRDSLRWRATCQDLVPKILQQATPTEISILAKCWFGQPLRPDSSAIAQPLAELARAANHVLADSQARLQPDSQADRLWLIELQRFSGTWVELLEGCTSTMIDSDHAVSWRSSLTVEFQETLSDYLDQKLLEQLRDGSPWTAEEGVAFGRLLQRGSNDQRTPMESAILTATPPLISAGQLDSQSARYRGQWVRFQGSVRRVEKIQRSHPAFDIDQYWVMWLRGVDDSSQPVAVYTTHRLAEKLSEQVQSELFPDVELTGLVAKRLAYTAQSGVEVAPTLFTGTILQFAQDQSNPATIDLEQAKRQTWQAIAVGMLMSLVAATFVYLKLRGTKKRSLFKTTQAILGSCAFFLGWPSELMSEDPVTPPWVLPQEHQEKIVEIAQIRLAEVLANTDPLTIDHLLLDQPTSLPDSVLRVMTSLEQIGWQRMHAAGRSIPVGGSWNLQPIELHGWVCDALKIPLSAEQQERFTVGAAQTIYRLQVVLADITSTQNGSTDHGELTEDSLQTFALCAQVPSFWLNAESLYQPIRIQGFAVVPLATTADATLSNSTYRQLRLRTETICLISGSVDWGFFDFHSSPSKVATQPKLKPAWLELARAGWNLSWLDLLAQTNQKAMSASEALPLTKMLEITARNPTLVQDADRSPVEIMKDPLSNIGAAIDWRIRLVHGSRVEWLPSEPHQQTSAPVRYYQYDGFVKIPGQQINYQSEGAEQPVSFREEFPVTVLMQADSPFASQAAISSRLSNWKIGRTARVTGRFFRLWSYHSQRLSTPERQMRQVVPLVIASSLEADLPVPRQLGTIGWFGYAMGTGIILILAGILVSVFQQTFRAPK